VISEPDAKPFKPPADQAGFFWCTACRKTVPRDPENLQAMPRGWVKLTIVERQRKLPEDPGRTSTERYCSKRCQVLASVREFDERWEQSRRAAAKAKGAVEAQLVEVKRGE